MNRSTLKRAADFGVRFLQTAGEASAYSRQQQNDLKLAIAMLKAIPDLIPAAEYLCMAPESDDGSDPTVAAAQRAAAKARDAIRRATDRDEGTKI